ncbi:MAG: response regulator [Planctomycetes bacterium]|nr:response regulator [Planctomycetota bacterium]
MSTPLGRVLVVDDEDSLRDVLRLYLVDEGFEVADAASAEEAIDKFRDGPYDSVLSDIRMPDRDGISLLQRLKERNGDTPVILMTGSPDLEIAIQAVKHGAYDFLVKPFPDLQIVSLAVQRAAQHAKLLREHREYQRSLEDRVQERTRQLNAALRDLEDMFEQNKRAHLESIIVLSKVAEINDEDTGNHILRMSKYSEEIARGLNLDEAFVEEIAYSSPMHDIGKISIPPSILRKPGKLTAEEFEIMKTHTVRGNEILTGIPFLERAREISISHHERFDGTGYPQAVKGEEIPLSGRIVALADVFDALTSERCYKPAFPIETALRIIKEEEGRQFDPRVMKGFFRRLDEVLATKEMFQ